ncbi:hypothetical protein AVEN_261781-1 [Araneus ventricosus]|uniref:Uncharacterized protein n=1 Tax=Araneus ventricosus TaxID=182803 RepID=A0A4Y2LY01_ARAVE|nr:hypothetical protein AVEN_261781-1 [Araneus ventricosus]
MHEYEFRLVVQSPSPFDAILNDIWQTWGRGMLKQQHVWYAKAHVRFRNKSLETKTIVSVSAVYYDALWFKWVHSLETPHKQWSKTTHGKFLDAVGNVQCPFRKEARLFLKLDERAQVYTFRHSDGTYRLVFELEFGTFSKPLETSPTDKLLDALEPYGRVYEPFRPFPAPPYELNESVTRKPVTCVANFDNLQGGEHVVAHKLDGVFGFVYSYPNCLKEKWEGDLQKRRNGFSLGDGIVFSAEKMPDNTVVLLDVYQVRGIPTAKWCRRSILLNYLTRLRLPEGYRVQQYRCSVIELPRCPFPTDGYVSHNTLTDEITKIKYDYSLDVVYMGGFFWLPGKDKPWLCKRFKSLENNGTLQEGRVYEVSTRTGRMVRERTDRFTGNTWQQIENILEKEPWRGPPIQEVIKVGNTKKKRKTRGK